MKNTLKLLISIIMFWMLFRYIDLNNLITILAKSHGGTIFIAFLFQLASTYLAAYRWQLIMKELVFDEKLSYYVKSYFKGTFFNQVLPSSIGGDAVRVIDLTQKGYDKKDAFYGVFVDRIVGLVGLLVLNLLATLLFYGTFDAQFSALLILITSAGITGFFFLFTLDKINFLKNYTFLNLFYRLGKRLNSLYSTKTTLFKHITISVGVHLLTVIAMFGLALSIDFHLSFETFLIAVPPVFLLTIIPISLAGWGIREGAMVGIFLLVGADETKVLAMSILYGILLILSSVPGAYFWVKSKKAT